MRRRPLRWTCLFAAVCLFSASAASADQSVGGTDDKGGSVTGVVKFEGKKKPAAVLAPGGALCAGPLAGPVMSERWVFGKNDGIKNVLVQVTKGPAVDGRKFAAPAKPLIVDQVGCRYVPHVSAAIAGQRVQFRNSDATLHNIHTHPRGNEGENFGQPVKGMVGDTKLKKPEIGIYVACDVHAWMSCYVHIMPHPFFAITDGDGNFTVKGLPAGEYELSVWHEVRIFQPKPNTSLKFTVKEGAAVMEIVLTPKKAEE